MLHVFRLGPSTTSLPHCRRASLLWSVTLHLVVAAALVSFGHHTDGRPATVAVPQPSVGDEHVRHFVFIVSNPVGHGGGGGGGGNRQTGPIRRAEGVGKDPITLRVAKPVAVAGDSGPVEPLPQLVLDAKPLASGNVDVIGLPNGGVTFGTSTGPGTGAALARVAALESDLERDQESVPAQEAGSAAAPTCQVAR